MQRVRIGERGQLRDDRLPDLVRRHTGGRPVPGDGMQPPLERDRTLLDEPCLRAVDVAVDRWPELRVEREHKLGRDGPDGGRDTGHAARTVSSARPSTRPSETRSITAMKYDRLTSLDASFLHMDRLEFP